MDCLITLDCLITYDTISPIVCCVQTIELIHDNLLYYVFTNVWGTAIPQSPSVTPPQEWGVTIGGSVTLS